MKKIDSTVKKETCYILIWVLILSTVMQAVFLILHKWDYTVLLGNLLSAAAVTLNFLFMGITVQNAVEKDEKDAKNTMKVSQSLRTLALFVIVVVGVVAPWFNTWACVIPLFFPRVGMLFRTKFKK